MPLRFPNHRHARIVFVAVVLILILLVFVISPYPTSSDSPAASPVSRPINGPLAPAALAARNLAAAHEALTLLASSSWTSFAPGNDPGDTEDGNTGAGDDAAAPPPAETGYLNLTGFRTPGRFGWHDLTRFRERCVDWRSAALRGSRKWGDEEGDAPVWRNVSGIVQGGWVRRRSDGRRHDGAAAGYDLNTIAPWVDWSLATSEWGRNVTGREGLMTIMLENKPSALDYDRDHGHGDDDLGPDHGGDRRGDDGDSNERHRRHLKSPPGSSHAASLVRGVRADVTVEDGAGSSGTWDMRLHGVHWPRQGSLLLTTTSEKFDGIFGLPFLTSGPDYFLSSRELLARTLSEAIDSPGRDAAFADGAIPWTSDLEGGGGLVTAQPLPHCEYVLFAQVHPPRLRRRGQWGGSAATAAAGFIEEIERELENPVGVLIGPVPAMQMSVVLWSPDCGFFLESKGPPFFPPSEGRHLTGVKKEVQRQRVGELLLALAAIAYGQAQLLRLQIRESCTPSTMGRISCATMGVMVVADGIVLAAAVAWSFSAGFTLLPSLGLVYGSAMSTMIGGTFLGRIYAMRPPASRPRTTAATAATAAAAGTTDRLPGPVTAGPAVAIIPSDQDLGAEADTIAVAGPPPPNNNNSPPSFVRSYSSTVGRLILAGLAITFLAMTSTSWPARLRSLYLNGCAFGYFSLWVPQIRRNVLRNSRRSLAWRFVLGQSGLRLLPFGYFWLVPGNLLFGRTDGLAFALLVLWVWVQICVLAAQDVLGPRFGLPESWTPDAWDYHRLLREDALEAGGLPIGLILSPGSPPGSSGGAAGSWGAVEDSDEERGDDGGGGDGETGRRKRRRQIKMRKKRWRRRRRESGGGKVRIRAIDCAICTEPLEVAIVRAGEQDDSGVAGVLARRAYMVTPCRHIFHSRCLEGWMRYKLQCPICREDLPPL